MSGMAMPKAKVRVPLSVRTRVLGLGSRRLACALLQISDATYLDAVDPNGMLRPETLTKVEQALKFIDEPAVQQKVAT